MGVGAQANVTVIFPELVRTDNGVELWGRNIIISDYMNSVHAENWPKDFKLCPAQDQMWCIVGTVQGLEDVSNDEDWERVEFADELVEGQSDLEFSDRYGWIAPVKLPPFKKAFEIHIGGKESHWIDDEYREITLVPSDLLQDLYTNLKNPPEEDGEDFKNDNR